MVVSKKIHIFAAKLKFIILAIMYQNTNENFCKGTKNNSHNQINLQNYGKQNDLERPLKYTRRTH